MQPFNYAVKTQIYDHENLSQNPFGEREASRSHFSVDETVLCVRESDERREMRRLSFSKLMTINCFHKTRLKEML